MPKKEERKGRKEGGREEGKEEREKENIQMIWACKRHDIILKLENRSRKKTIRIIEI